jgi:hypothetical protein
LPGCRMAPIVRNTKARSGRRSSGAASPATTGASIRTCRTSTATTT